MTIEDSLICFRDGIQKTNDNISIAFTKDNRGDDICTEDQKNFIVSSAFLNMFICWESFIEDVFSKYLIGEPSINGSRPVCYISPNDKEHALKMLIGTQKYVDWANKDIITRLAKLYLRNGEPIVSNIMSISTELADLKTIRNAAAHLSSTTRPQLDALATRVLSRTVTNTNVSDFIMQLHPDYPEKTILQNYQEILDVAANNIAENVI